MLNKSLVFFRNSIYSNKIFTSDDPSDSSSVSLFIINESSPFVDDCMISEPEYALDVSLARECELRIIGE